MVNKKALGNQITQAYIDLVSEESFDDGVDEALDKAEADQKQILGESTDWYGELDDKRDTIRLIGAILMVLQNQKK